MVLSTAIFLIFLAAIVRGWHRGLLAVAASLVIYLMAMIVARTTAPVLGRMVASSSPALSNRTAFSGNLLTNADPTAFFYNGIAFVIIFTVTSVILHYLVRQLSWVRHVPVLGMINSLAGAVIALLIIYLMLYVLLLIFQLWSNGWWQYQFSQSELAQWIVNNTPQLASLLVHWLG